MDTVENQIQRGVSTLRKIREDDGQIEENPPVVVMNYVTTLVYSRIYDSLSDCFDILNDKGYLFSGGKREIEQFIDVRAQKISQEVLKTIFSRAYNTD
jgi:hypothetical protein